MARLRRDDKSGSKVKQPTDGDVKALGEILIKKLEDSLKDCDQTIKVYRYNLYDYIKNLFYMFIYRIF